MDRGSAFPLPSPRPLPPQSSGSLFACKPPSTPKQKSRPLISRSSLESLSPLCPDSMPEANISSETVKIHTLRSQETVAEAGVRGGQATWDSKERESHGSRCLSHCPYRPLNLFTVGLRYWKVSTLQVRSAASPAPGTGPGTQETINSVDSAKWSGSQGWLLPLGGRGTGRGSGEGWTQRAGGQGPGAVGLMGGLEGQYVNPSQYLA